MSYIKLLDIVAWFDTILYNIIKKWYDNHTLSKYHYVLNDTIVISTPQ